MKLKLFVLLLFVCFSITVFQNSAHAFEFGLGPKVGLGAGLYTGEDWTDALNASNVDNRAVFSFSLGLLLEMNFYQGNVFGIGIQPEFLYTRTGGGWTQDDDNYQDNYFNTFQVPIYFKPRFKAGPGFFTILVGPDILISLGDYKQITVIGGSETETDKEVDNDYCIGMGAGLGYDLKLGPGRLQLGITYTTYFTGFRNVSSTKKIYNNMIHFNVAYSFMVVK